jgi:hypothetical protein
MIFVLPLEVVARPGSEDSAISCCFHYQNTPLGEDVKQHAGKPRKISYLGVPSAQQK